MSCVVDLSDRYALVTGASRGIGAEIVRALASAGADVTCIARDSVRLDQLVASVAKNGGKATGAAGSVSDATFVAGVVDAMPQIDILVNNVGINYREPVDELNLDHVREILNVNVLSLIHITGLVSRRMLANDTKGLIVSMSSTQGHRAGPGRAVYAASKHAVEGFTKSIAVELGPKGIRAVAIAPTWVFTDMSSQKLSDPAFRAEVERQIPLGRIADATEVAELVLFLNSPAAQLLNGASLHVDGGLTC